ncbi:MAG TPA: glutamine synthetase III [Polyangiaceae bacterium]|nr:glutamine synthetase III [Polyangiaceae bacterium]
MTGISVRKQAIADIAAAPSAPYTPYTESPDALFGSNVFGLAAMKAHLPKDVFRSLKRTIEKGEALNASTADVVAAAMREWAMAKGATHFAHLFYPLTGAMAEKHDSFLSPDGDGGAISEFSGKLLIQGEPDASSFPSGGIRQTAEARGYTAWDVTSPAFIVDTTLYIPTAFVSWTGEALDKKTPLLRSQQALNRQAQRILKLFGHENPAPVFANAGAEQEYFLIDRRLFLQRPDLLNAGRTLFGAKPPRGQEFEDLYFGVIPERVLAFMVELEREAFKLGIPAKTRHNEVAPAQFEIAPVYEPANIAADHQQMIMMLMRRCALHHGFECLTHEKPFAGVNGSGKHVNFSFGNSTQGNLLEPGDTPHENAQFLVFCAATMRAVHKHSGLLRAAIASAANDHRLGANEAPPAILSVFLGEQLSDVFDQLKAGGAKSSKSRGTLEIGVDTLPKLPKDAGDRNRTSPFAFTGNKFEFRAVGGGQAISGPLIALNVAVAEACDYIAGKLEAAVSSGKSLNTAVQTLLTELATEHAAIVFNGNNYSDEWHREAEKRGLPNYKTSVDALPVLNSPEVVKAFDKYGVLSPRELRSRYDIYIEQYIKTVLVEAKLVTKIGKTVILPAAIRYQAELGAASSVSSVAKKLLGEVSGFADKLDAGLVSLEKALGHESSNPDAEAKHLKDEVLPLMLTVRSAADSLETLIADDLWPLPTYQEMLYIR